MAELVATQVGESVGRNGAKRLLPLAAGMCGSDRNFRRLVGDATRSWRIQRSRCGGQRPAIWTSVGRS